MRRCPNPGVFLIGVGLVGIATSAFADSVGIGHPGFGLDQLVGLVIGAFVSVVGLGKVLFLDTQKLARVLAALYVAGIFYLGLRPFPLETGPHGMLLSVGDFHWRDFMINTVGFIFLGYLLMLSLRIRQALPREFPLVRRAIAVTVAGGVISLFLEVSQHYLISGRYSSLIDLIANVFGTLVGIAVYAVLEQKRASRGGMTGIERPREVCTYL